MMILGTQIAFAARVMRDNTGVFAGKKAPAARNESVTLIMQVVISLAVLAAAGYLLKHPASAAQEKAVWAAVGTVIGYWLH